MTFEEFVGRHGAELLRLAFVLTGNPHLAEDLTQTALADAYRHWRKVTAAADPHAYVRRMLINAHLSWRRRRWTREQPVEVAETDLVTHAEPGDDLADRDALRALLTGLAPRARAVLILRYYADLDDAAIAAAMGVTESAVRATASRALATLRAEARPAVQEEIR